MQTVKYKMYSVIPLGETRAPAIRMPGFGANPVNAPGKRESVPLTGGATPRVQHPRLNTTPWPVSYAQARTQPKTATVKAKNNARKRRNVTKNKKAHSAMKIPGMK